MNRDYTAQKIITAMEFIVVGDKLLRERIAEAHMYLLEVSCREGFEAEFAEIDQQLSTVSHGDFSLVTPEELTSVAKTVMNMYRRLPRP